MEPVILPVLGANMTHGTILRWLKREGETVHPGDALFEVETDKANIEVEAESAGLLKRIVASEGERIPVLQIVGFVGAAEEAVPPEETWESLTPKLPDEASEPGRAAPQASRPPREEARGGTGGRIPASPAARRLAREKGISLEGLAGSGVRGEVTRADVEAALAAPRVAPGSGQVEAAFVEALRRDADTIRRLSSETKVDLYRRHGARIGEGVRIDAGALIVAGEISIGSGARIGADSTIDCERLELGRLAAFGKRTKVDCREVRIGDALWSKDDVIIGGGGRSEPGARLEAGDACFFGEGAYLNTGHPLVFGDEVCIGARAMLLTHSHWQSALRGYPSVFGPIHIEEHAFIGNQVFVFPGVTIGAGATVMVNSFVPVNVPAATLVGGVPARVVRHVEPPSRDEQVEIVRGLMSELMRTLREKGLEAHTQERDGIPAITLGRRGSVTFEPTWSGSPADGSSGRRVVLTFAEEPVTAAPPRTTVFELSRSEVSGPQDELSDEVREFLRRRGIRFRPFAWRYGVGHFEGDRFMRRR